MCVCVVDTFCRYHSKSILSSFLHTVKWFQLLLYNSHNLTSVIYLHSQFVLFDS